ncbi:UBA/THIF-type NAD/FAD binding protein [Geobacter metallireducens RCH3]|uniref:ThiF family protein n=1 Tax=Geobacter metallireducens (strain ATCC 53774 / DSM 7210 / GS-15) TaxID=269799 RepID=Q39TZ9_GEOMG|nr:ThiF family adenylyltransferase [Geobacter metallireducens]ABB32275.1 ThiF family protein [Geobacter metallireducens GS-15]EHP85167.1 UBA/THIF-type NAD/FAD binding protein [Geobacter metallireducens RCH3]
MDSDSLIRNEFARNIGLLTVEEQKRLLASRVAVAGAGGVGGIHVLTLARLGVGCFTIADHDSFDVVNISRQFGAFHSTLNRNKAQVLAEMVKDINPNAEVRVMEEGVTEDNINAFLDGVDVYVDSIDFFEIDMRRLIFNSCRAKGIYALTAAPLGFGATLQVFDPEGMSFDDYFGIDDQTPPLEKIAAFAAGLTPNPYHLSYMDASRVSFKRRTGPAVSPACTLAASLVATEIVKILTGKGELRPIPCYLQFDMLLNKVKMGKIALGAKSPSQKKKRRLIMENLLMKSED